MIKELSKKNIIDKKVVYVQVCPGDDIYDIEWLLIDKYNCYYHNNGDYHNCTEHYIGDVKNHDVYFEIMYNKKKNINVMREINILRENQNISLSSKMINRTKKIKKLIKK